MNNITEAWSLEGVTTFNALIALGNTINGVYNSHAYTDDITKRALSYPKIDTLAVLLKEATLSNKASRSIAAALTCADTSAKPVGTLPTDIAQMVSELTSHLLLFIKNYANPRLIFFFGNEVYFRGTRTFLKGIDLPPSAVEYLDANYHRCEYIKGGKVPYEELSLRQKEAYNRESDSAGKDTVLTQAMESREKLWLYLLQKKGTFQTRGLTFPLDCSSNLGSRIQTAVQNALDIAYAQQARSYTMEPYEQAEAKDQNGVPLKEGDLVVITADTSIYKGETARYRRICNGRRPNQCVLLLNSGKLLHTMLSNVEKVT